MVIPLRRPTFASTFVLAAFVFLLGMQGVSALTFEHLYSFPNPPWSPAQPVTQGPDGNYYGVAAMGTTNQDASAVIFRMTPQGKVSTVKMLVDTLNPAPLVLGSDKNLYGYQTYGG